MALITFQCQVSKQDIEDTFDVPFRACVLEGKVSSVLCSYFLQSYADPNLLRNTAEGTGSSMVTYRRGVFYDNQHCTATPKEAGADAMKAGLDLDCGPFLAVHTEEAIDRRLLSEVDVNNSLVNTMTVQMRLGMFDVEPSRQPYGHLGPPVCSAANNQLAFEAAQQGIVLLKNRGPSLPLSALRHRTVAVIGPNSDVIVTLTGNYAGVACGYILCNSLSLSIKFLLERQKKNEKKKKKKRKKDERKKK
ncbi:hypothetical protein AQUCO_04000061v1 [Aquilegia coerulea]|uniref:Glycoside hydrolase family 3 C-terminal domain-containing protein n=1 Tax=Aquilegia coerulea TaxID=218851 RepID=A0A2G5CQZ7_AQUCA|nr:hypothetical protein AQUCO_04000061v1 [Aquilegia coerulea]